MKYIAAPLERTGFISLTCSLSRRWANCSGFMNLAGWSCSYWQMRCSDKWWGWGISAHLGQRMRLWQQHQLCSPEGENEPQLVREVLCLQWPMWHMPAHGQCWWRWLQHLLYLELLGAKHWWLNQLCTSVQTEKELFLPYLLPNYSCFPNSLCR